MQSKPWWATAGVCLVLLVGEAHSQQPRYAPPLGGTPPSTLNLFRFDSRSPRNYDNVVMQAQQTQYQLQNLSTRQQSDFRATQQSLSQLREAEERCIAQHASTDNTAVATYSNFNKSRELQSAYLKALE